MRFEFNDEQVMLRDLVRGFASDHFDDATLAEVSADANHASRSTAWSGLQELGLTSLLIPAEFGGAGGCVTDACIVAEELGAAAAPVPYVAAAIISPSFILRCGNRDDLAALVTGGPCCPIVGDDLQFGHGDASVVWDWFPGANGLAWDHSGARVVAADGAKAIQPTYDPLHPLAAVPAISGSSAPLDEQARRATAISRVGLAAFLLGLARTALETAVEYAKVREQYGRPIGTFQAVQHMCADMLVDVEASRSIVHGASWSVEHAAIDDAERKGAAALSWAAHSSVRVCETSIQVLGGIGVTIEHPAHRRLRSAHHFGSVLGGGTGAARTLGQHKLSIVTG